MEPYCDKKPEKREPRTFPLQVSFTPNGSTKRRMFFVKGLLVSPFHLMTTTYMPNFQLHVLISR
jgi:hypothetical protein